MMRVGGMKRYFILMQRWIYRTNPNNPRPSHIEIEPSRMEQALEATSKRGMRVAHTGGIISSYELATLSSLSAHALPHSLTRDDWMAETGLLFGGPLRCTIKSERQS